MISASKGQKSPNPALLQRNRICRSLRLLSAAHMGPVAPAMLSRLSVGVGPDLGGGDDR